MTRRTTLWICVGVILVGVGVLVVCMPAARPQVEVRFVRYIQNQHAVLEVTNRGRPKMSIRSTFPMYNLPDGVLLWPEQDPDSINSSPFFFCVLEPRHGTQLVATPVPKVSPPLSGTVSLQCVPEPSPILGSLESLLRNFAIYIVNTGFVVTVDVPSPQTQSRPTNTPPASLPR